MADGIPPALRNRLIAALIVCGPFQSNADLRTLFNDETLSPWRNDLPQRRTVRDRVEATIDFLYPRWSSAKDDNALALFLEVASERHDPADQCHGTLAQLAEEVRQSHRQRAGQQSEPEPPLIVEPAGPQKLEPRPRRLLLGLSMAAVVIVSAIVVIWIRPPDACRTPSLEFRVDSPAQPDVLTLPNSLFLVDAGDSLTIRAVLDGGVPAVQETYSCAWFYLGDGGIVERQGCALRIMAGADATEDLVRVEIRQDRCPVSLVEVLHIANR